MEGLAPSIAQLPLSPKKSLKREKTRDCLSAASEHISTSSSRGIKPLAVRRVASLVNPLTNAKVMIQGGLCSRTRVVSFDKEARIVGHVPTRGELTPEEFTTIWYSKDEFKEMKKEYVPIVKKLAKKLPLDDGEEGRGLEHKTPRGCKSRQNNRFQAMDAVLDEQERQFEMERKDADYIAQIYRQSSAHCQMNAYLSAKKDAEFVQQMRETSCAEGTRDATGQFFQKQQSPLPQASEMRLASLRYGAPEQSPTTPVRKDSGKTVCIVVPQVVLSPQLVISG
ncbi:hypothetical protein IV203_034858 [Nitzschia inconspicua]|uniref:Uncharacterized protein n=1 Tax=Nitzschia inconspicua TaxID=303405 RepID=A0A9K3LDF9_9STRA|nr:hypothetical protein IV203_034858 [Nitzschia inconspicua]